jgi:hypothetical protein
MSNTRFTASCLLLALSLAGCGQALPTPSAPTTPGGPIANLAGMLADAYAPTNRSTFLAVSPDGARVAVAWLHNDANASPQCGEPTAYAVVGDPAVPGSFGAPAVIGRRTQAYGPGADTSFQMYNTAHNAPFVVARPGGGFVGLSLPMNANGYAQGMPATGDGYMRAEIGQGYGVFSAPSPQRVADPAAGSSLSEMSGGTDTTGTMHLFGQGHLGAFQGGFGYQRLAPGADALESRTLAAAYRVNGLSYFGEGDGYLAPTPNAAGHQDLHVAFAWNARGESPNYGLYYLVSHDGGDTWRTINDQPVSLPLKMGENDADAAVIRANLSAVGYGGDGAGHRAIRVAATDTGAPLIVRPFFTDDGHRQVQHWLYTCADGRWVGVRVGPPVLWDAAGSGVAYNARTGRVNVVLLDPGNATHPARVLLESQPLADVAAGHEAWQEEEVASVPTRTYASHLQVREVPGDRFVALFENNYVNPGKVEPMLLSVPMR